MPTGTNDGVTFNWDHELEILTLSNFTGQARDFPLIELAERCGFFCVQNRWVSIPAHHVARLEWKPKIKWTITPVGSDN